MTPAERKKVAAVIRRLTREPLTALERRAVLAMSPGKHARWVTGAAKRFLRNAQALDEMTEAQRRFLWRLALQYRDRLDGRLRQEAWARRAWAFQKEER